VDDDIRVLEVLDQAGDVGEIALNELRAEGGKVARSTWIADERNDLVTSLEQGAGDPTANEASRAGDHDPTAGLVD